MTFYKQNWKDIGGSFYKERLFSRRNTDRHGILNRTEIEKTSSYVIKKTFSIKRNWSKERKTTVLFAVLGISPFQITQPTTAISSLSLSSRCSRQRLAYLGTTNLTLLKLRTQTLWWVQNVNLRHIYFIGFFIFGTVFCAFGFKV